jgi:GAF domain-containing protein
MMHADDLSRLDMSSADAKRAAYLELAQQTQALFAGENDWLANCAQFSALIYQQIPTLNWAGFYFNKNHELILGPFQGKVACVRIPFNKGVCGACATTMQTQLVADVHAFPGHIACDGASNSEIVIPVIINNRLVAVFDIDSPQLARFDDIDQAGLEQCLTIMMTATQWPELL